MIVDWTNKSERRERMTQQASIFLGAMVITLGFIVLVLVLLGRCSYYLKHILKELERNAGAASARKALERG